MVRPGRIEALPVGVFDPDRQGAGFARGTSLRIVVWNVHKALDPGLPKDLEAIVRNRDPHLLALQESRADLHLPRGFAGHHATSFVRRLQGKHEGVMTLSRLAPLAAHRVRSSERELFVLTPKAALITLYRLDDGHSLCLLNLHGLNFDPSGKQLARQLHDLHGMIEHLDGPLLVAGDFNTWNEARLGMVEDVIGRLGMIEVAPDVPGGRTGGIRNGRLERLVNLDRRLHLDRLYARGFRRVRASWLEEYRTSDHVALFAELDFES